MCPIERWLMTYNFKVIHIAGKNNIADPLSRLLKVKDTVPTRLACQAEGRVRFIAKTATPRAMTTQEIECESASDPVLIGVRECIDTGRWDKCVDKR